MHRAANRLLAIFMPPLLLILIFILILHEKVATLQSHKEAQANGIDAVHYSPDPSNNKLKLYVYDLPHEHSLEHYLDILAAETAPKSNCDWNLNVCAENWAPNYSSIRQAGGDSILIQKFRRYPNRVLNAEDADLFVVPYPHSSICRLYTQTCWFGCTMYCSKERSSTIANDVQNIVSYN